MGLGPGVSVSGCGEGAASANDVRLVAEGAWGAISDLTK